MVNPKYEILNTKQIRNSNFKNQGFEFRKLKFVSDFGTVPARPFKSVTPAREGYQQFL